MHRPLFVAIAASLASCGGEQSTLKENDRGSESDVYRDGDDWADDAGAHPQVLRIMGAGGFCTAWLSSSNTLTTSAHCLANATNFVGWTYDTSQQNSSTAQFNALKNLGSSIGGFIHPLGGVCPTNEDDCCWGADIVVLVFDPVNAVPRNVMRPLAIKAATADEPECDGADRCVMMVGTGLTGEDECHDEDATPATLDRGATQLFLESGLGNGHCPANGGMLYGEYDYDDSSSCQGDSGSPIFWGGTNEVFATNRGSGGDGSDDVVGPVLWVGGENTARDFFMLRAGDQDQDGIQAAHDNCDRTPNPGQEDWNGNQVGDACEDSDGDGLLDSEEILRGTAPGNADTDGDGLGDAAEVQTHLTNPLLPDTDGDGLTDGLEVLTHGTNPLDADSDDDGLTDGQEVLTYGTNPLDADSDDDGLTDSQEIRTHGTNPLDSDSDNDGLTDGPEVLTHGTNPLDSDSDDDGLNDGQEVLTYGTDPLDSDTDNDLLGDGFEVTHALDPLNADTDGDGVIDGRDTEWIEAAITALPDSAFKAPGHRNSIAAHLAQVERFAQRGEFDKALHHLGTLSTHVDGCGPTADNNDWLVDCTAQLEVRALLDMLAANL
ncbi:trypsin-like serine protease [Myxococcus llanfairpwllgwyngyllgogerychwyrndrobwllllantysiliogogogochensis]|uniref:Trypsin-like serine protease n=1 Tax=Myxococcus llanfairpwllgwyngyllgogerychwyrndrobwllllantysiliogogogochensis TaxID=2590453 RepID=A0A540X9X2_9BACT|nr:trypsin-like serine protease [Myxococcus llanfairpwllgwyngyllgogerychwyrndrobwllllantysiliogogogochensis]